MNLWTIYDAAKLSIPADKAEAWVAKMNAAVLLAREGVK